MDPIGKVTKTITAQNTFSDAISMRKGGFTFTISGINGDTVYLQRSLDGSTWLDLAYYTEDGVYAGLESSHGTKYRFGVKTGGYSAGTIIGTISF
jgi:hypothetical protein